MTNKIMFMNEECGTEYCLMSHTLRVDRDADEE